MRCYIFDIDGTLSNGDHRLHHIQKDPKDWDSYFEACDGDGAHAHIVGLARDLMAAGAVIVMVSGRSDLVINKTLVWLHSQGVMGPLYMRSQGDHTPDDVLKIKMLELVRADGYDPIMAFDDRDRVVAAWRAAGIPCAQVAPGDF